MSQYREKRLDEIIRDHQDDILTTLVVLEALAEGQQACGCPNCRAKRGAGLIASAALLQAIADSTGTDPEAVMDLIEGTKRRLVMGAVTP